MDDANNYPCVMTTLYFAVGNRALQPRQARPGYRVRGEASLRRNDILISAAAVPDRQEQIALRHIGPRLAMLAMVDAGVSVVGLLVRVCELCAGLSQSAAASRRRMIKAWRPAVVGTCSSTLDEELHAAQCESDGKDLYCEITFESDNQGMK
ncbi:hypothetical protein N658DRAFT_145748 [Parathielavia hyrcaniae]|uniref:Uncharacterized protein n=1 Tax=Parathielavia hyrcaniae TaxID=113614 RepID=A0AAN6T0S3_9PEZI|nr:hypothetical protein N658DRAFT_145748 [Parathielavia hyrcaniae]